MNLVLGDITQISADAIVGLPAGKCSLGKAANLLAKYVIHIPAIDYTTGKRASFSDAKKAF